MASPIEIASASNSKSKFKRLKKSVLSEMKWMSSLYQMAICAIITNPRTGLPEVKLKRERMEKRARIEELMFGCLNGSVDVTSLAMEDATKVLKLIEEYQALMKFPKDDGTPTADDDRDVGAEEDKTKASDCDNVN